jgi:hypothetical protein
MCLDMGSTPTCADAPFNTFPYCNPNLTYIDRAKDIARRMTIAQKISQLGTWAPAVQSDNISIAAYQWWSEALHGIAESPGVHFWWKITLCYLISSSQHIRSNLQQESLAHNGWIYCN